MLDIILAACLIGLPMFYWHQTLLARMIPLCIIGAILCISALVHGMNTGLSLIIDAPAIALGCFALWVVGSMNWTDSSQSLHEAHAWLSMLLIGYLSRYADPAWLLGIIFAVGTVFAILTLYYKFRQEKEMIKQHFIFGNQVHNGAFNIIPFFISLWATVNVHPAFAVSTLILGANFWANPSRGAIIGTAAGLFTLSIFIFKWFALAALLVVPLLVYEHKRHTEYDQKRRIGHFLSRLIYWTAALQMIKRRYLFGWGLNMFRKQYPEINPSLFKEPWLVDLYKRSGGIEKNTGHRPHNELLDIGVEMGLIGVIIFCSVFYHFPWSQIDPFFIGAFVAFAVMSMFFFPLREVHTAIGFWVFAGVLMGSGATVPVGVNLLIGITAIAILVRIIYSNTIKAMGIYFYDRAINPKYKEDRLKNIKMAVGCDPNRARYLMYAFLMHIDQHPDVAFEYSMRQLANFDGGKVKWGVYDQFARAVLRFPSILMAELYLEKALKLNPEYERSQELYGFVQATKEKMQVKVVEMPKKQATGEKG